MSLMSLLSPSYLEIARALRQPVQEPLDQTNLTPSVSARVTAFRALVQPGQPLPFFHLPEARGLTTGCPSCGGDYAGGSYRCGPCSEAARLVVGEPRG